MAPSIKGVTALDGYVVRVLFANGEVRDVDMESMLDGPVFRPLKERAVFESVRVDDLGDTIVWPNGVDLDPDVMYGLERPARGPAPRVSVPISSSGRGG